MRWGEDNNQPGQWQLHLAVMVGCRICIVVSHGCAVISCGCVMVMVSCVLQLWLVVAAGRHFLQLHCRLPWLWLLRSLHFCGCGWCCHIVSSFPAVESWLLWWLCLAVMVACCGSIGLRCGFLWLHHGCCGCCLAVVVGCCGCIGFVISCSWAVIVAVVAPCDCGWFFHLCCHFPWLHVVGCCGWSPFPMAASLFTMAASWLLPLLHLAVVVGCCGCHHCRGCFCGCCAQCWLWRLMIVAVAVVSVLVSHCSMVVSLAPVCVFSLAHWQPVFKVTDSVMDVAASMASEFL